MKKIFKNLVSSKKGATSIEYGLIVSLIFLASVVAIGNFSDSVNAMWNGVTNTVTAS